jgi:hypothetical protein
MTLLGTVSYFCEIANRWRGGLVCLYTARWHVVYGLKFVAGVSRYREMARSVLLGLLILSILIGSLHDVVRLL